MAIAVPKTAVGMATYGFWMINNPPMDIENTAIEVGMNNKLFLIIAILI